MFEKDLRFNLLYDLYGALLSERQAEIFSLYYAEDLSLAEIAEDTGLSRQGVRASVKKSEQELLELEAKLHLAERAARTKADGEEALRLTRELKRSLADAPHEAAEKLDRIADLVKSISG